MGAFIKLIILAIISIVMLVLAGLAYDWLRDKLGIKSQPAQPQPAAHPPELVLGVYSQVGFCLTRCVNASGTCGLMHTVHPEHNHVPLKERIRSNKQYPVILVYEFQRTPIGGINIQNLRAVKYNTIPVEKMADILNRSLESHCIYNGCVPVKIVAGKDIGDGRVRLAVVEI